MAIDSTFTQRIQDLLSQLDRGPSPRQLPNNLQFIPPNINRNQLLNAFPGQSTHDKPTSYIPPAIPNIEDILRNLQNGSHQ
jgi:hypothetical protein